MFNKTTSFLLANYPYTYMEHLCVAHPDLELGKTCVSWFRQATKHCVELFNNVQPPSSCIWTTVKNFIFPERSTELLSKMTTINIEANRLSTHDCQALFLDIVNDYIEIAPRFSAESKTNVSLWLVIYSLIVIMTLITVLMETINFFKKYAKTTKKCNPLNEVFKPEKRLQAICKRSLHFAKSEVRLLQVPRIIKPEELIAPDGTNILVLKVSKKLDFIHSIVESTLQTSGQLYRPSDQYNKKSEFKKEAFTKALKFLDNNCKKLRLLLMFDEDPVYENNFIQTRENIRPSSPRSLTTPTRSSISSYKRTSTTVSGVVAGSAIPTKLLPTSTSFGFHSPRSNTQKQGTTPRVTTPRSSAIPPNVAKQSLKNTGKKFV